MQLPESVETTPRDIDQVERRGAGTAYAGGVAQQTGKLVEVFGKSVRHFEGESGSYEAGGGVGHRGDPELLVSLPRAAVGYGRVCLISGHVEDDADRRNPARHGRDADGIRRVVMQVVGGSVEWVHDPHQFGGVLLGCELLATHGGVRDLLEEVRGDDSLRLSIHLGDEIADALSTPGGRVRRPRCLSNERCGSTGRGNRNRK